MKCLAWTPLLLLAACEVSRPYGWFVSPFDHAPDGGKDSGDDDDDGDDDGTDGPETGVTIPSRDGGRPSADGGMSGPEPPPPDSPLAPYAGTYLMRMDMYSSVASTVASTKLAVNNRISNLILAEIGVDGDRLVGHETFCHQTYAHDCTSGCVEGWTTTPDPGLAKLFPNANAPRAYRIEGDKLIAEQAVVALGFNDENVSESTTLPTSVDDARLWRPSPDRVGLVTRLRTAVKVVGLTQPFDCEVSAVQLFGSAFEGTLGDPAAPLEGVRFGLTLPPLPAAPIAASGTPSSFCNTKALNEQETDEGSGVGESYVRFVKTDIRGECPTVQVFDEQLPAAPPHP